MRKLMVFSENDIRQRMELDNPWWDDGRIDEFYKGMQSRPYIDGFYKLIQEDEIKRAIVLMGPRRVGKTVMIQHSIARLIKSGIDAKKILYISIDTPIYSGIGLEQLINIVEKAQNNKIKLKYIFFDEIQYLKEWEIHLKSIVDTYRNIKFVVSGSAAAALRMKSSESGAGRFTDFLLPPLTFYEYILLKKIDAKIEKHKDSGFCTTSDIKILNKHFLNYINFGGYPEVALSELIQADPGRYVKNDIIDKVLLKDLPGMYGIQDIQELNSLFSVICYNSGNEISLETLSKNSGVAKNTIIRYLKYLEAAFLIKTYARIDQNAKRLKRRTFFKVYLANPSMRSATFSPIKDDDPFIGNMIETAIFSQWVHDIRGTLFYARWNRGEIDIVTPEISPVWAVEIKWSDRYTNNQNQLIEQLKFCEKHSIRDMIVTTKTTANKSKMFGVRLEFIPAALYCYTVGKNLVRNRSINESLGVKNL